jgi:hypothetical protein
MDRKPVNSQMLRSVGYDKAAKELEVEFNNGGTYRFSGVPEEVHASMLTAPSVGKYFFANVKGKFNYGKV